MRITKNIYFSNNRDFMLEVSHGPTLVDHNVFMSQYGFDNYSQGCAIVHNLFCGKICNKSVMNRSTPYHYPHSTDVAGYCEIYSGDDRYFNNMFLGKWDDGGQNLEQFTKNCDRFTSPEEYTEGINELFASKGWVNHFTAIPQPVWIKDNAYSGHAGPSKNEKNAFIAKGLTAEIEECEGEYILTLNVPRELTDVNCEPVSTKRLGETRISAMPFEAPDGSDYDFSFDLVGQRYNGTVVPGPLAFLKTGTQRVCVWKK